MATGYESLKRIMQQTIEMARICHAIVIGSEGQGMSRLVKDKM